MVIEDGDKGFAVCDADNFRNSLKEIPELIYAISQGSTFQFQLRIFCLHRADAARRKLDGQKSARLILLHQYS